MARAIGGGKNLYTRAPGGTLLEEQLTSLEESRDEAASNIQFLRTQTLSGRPIDAVRLRALLASGEGIRYASLGDSTETGGPVYAEAGGINSISGPSLFALSLMYSDDNFMPCDPLVFLVSKPTEGVLSTILEGHFLVVTQSPSFTYTCKQRGPKKYNKLTIYYLQRTSDAAAIFDVVANSVTTSVDTYVPAINYAGAVNVSPRLAKVTVDIAATNDLSFTINNVRVIDRGSGVPSDGTAIIVGFALGEGVDFLNLAVSSTTLLNNSAANQTRGVTTDDRLQEAFDFEANVISLGFGTNDSKAGVSTVEDFKNDLIVRIEQIREQDPSTLIILTNDPRGEAASIYENNPAYNAAIKEVAEEMLCNFLDVQELFDDIPGLYSDEVHPNSNGYMTIGRALCAMFGVPFFLPRDRYLVSTKSELGSDPGQMFTSLNLVEGSDASGNFVEIGSITMNRPPSKYHLHACAKLILASTSDMTSEFKLELIAYTGPDGTGSASGTQLLDESYLIEPAASGVRVDHITLFGDWKFSTSKSFKIILSGKNYQLRVSNAISKLLLRYY